jgi:hypothetical protein
MGKKHEENRARTCEIMTYIFHERHRAVALGINFSQSERKIADKNFPRTRLNPKKYT